MEPQDSRDYPYLRAWHNYLGSSMDILQGSLDIARKESFPQDTVIIGFDASRNPVPLLFSELTNHSTIRIIKERAKYARTQRRDP